MSNGEFKKYIHNFIQNAIVKVFVGGEFQGTGFFITPNYVLTAYHCINCASNIVIETRFGDKLNVLLDENKSLEQSRFDIAVLKVLQTYHLDNCLPLGMISAEHVTDDIVAMGYPAAYENSTIGIFSGKIFQCSGNQIDSDTVKGQGQSGGPIYHYATRRIIGLASRGYQPEVMMNTGIARQFAPLFEKWTELEFINKKFAKYWDKRLSQIQEWLFQERLDEYQKNPNDVNLHLLAPLVKLIPLVANISLTDSELKNIAYKYAPPNPPSAPQDYDEKGVLIGLLEWLAQMSISSTGRMPLLDFVAQLSQVAPTHQEQIKAWINSIAEMNNIAENKKCNPIQKPPPSPSLQPYLLIDLKLKYKNKKYYSVQAWLFISSENVKNIYTKDDTILNDMPTLIEEILSVIDTLNVNHKQLTIEFILPRHLLCHNVEHWTDGYGEPIGINYQVVVRSRERLKEKRLQRSWHPYWNEAKKKGILQQVAKSYSVFVHETQLRKLKSQVDAGKLCFVVASVPNVLAEPDKNVFFALTKSGVPIALWPRRINNISEFKQQLSKLLSCTLEQLPQCIFKNRRHLWENNNEQHTGYHLSLLWDDPDRIPPDPELQDDLNKVPFELQKLHAPH